jgi:hypothetical protein
MNKKAKRRAFFVCLFIGLMYMSIVLRLPEKMNIVRVWSEQNVMPSSVVGPKPKKDANISLPEVPASIFKKQLTESEQVKTSDSQTETTQLPTDQHILVVDDKSVEPNLFIALPLVAHAIKEGLLEKDGLIFLHKEGYNIGTCKKPIDILRDKDEQGLKAISKLIGKRQSLDFLKKEGIALNHDIDNERIITGIGYSIEKEKILSLYRKYLTNEFQGLFPFVIQGMAIVRTKKGFEFSRVKEIERIDREKMNEPEWTMPNVTNLSMRTAIEKLALHTSKIKVYGNGNIVEQSPKAFERTRGETECIIYGRTAR